PSDNESRHIAELAKVKNASSFARTIESTILDAHLSDTSFRTLSIPQVIDPVHGSICQVLYCLSKRTVPSDAFEDLRKGENIPPGRHDNIPRSIGRFFGIKLSRFVAIRNPVNQFEHGTKGRTLLLSPGPTCRVTLQR